MKSRKTSTHTDGTIKNVFPAKGNHLCSMKQSYIYIMASKINGTLYIGVTRDLIKRVYEHKNNLTDGFTKRYQVHNLVYYEISENIEQAIIREKQLKKWRRQWKINLIEKDNPEWQDLYGELI